MSKSSSTGDLVPRDITEIMALQSKGSKGSRNKRGSSLGRAFSWFKGNNPKRNVSNGQGKSGSLGGPTKETTISRQFHDNSDSFRAGQKQDEQGKLTVHYTPTQHYQENVFIEGSRPKYLEDLHSEAREGLKILQQEEQNNGMDVLDNQSVSTGTTQEKDVNRQDKDGHFSFDITANPNSTSASTVSALSSRPVLTRQGSTFKPLNNVKKVEKTKKRGRRTTIMGIPQQVHRELCMGKGGLHKVLSAEDGDSPGTVTIPAIDGGAPVTNLEGARVQLQNIEALQISREEQLLKQHIQAVYYNSGMQTSNTQRPKSLAVPGITTSSSLLQEPQGPVMSISPQATYLSTIIPNAILPSAIDVIEIDRSCNRRSVHTVGKSSLASGSPGSSRSGGGAHDDPRSTSSKWSSSQSSETMVSIPSTTSFKGLVPPLQVSESVKEVNDLNEEKISINSSVSWSSFTSKAASQRLEYEEPTNAKETARNSRLMSRNHSVMKAKLPPAPPPRRPISSQHENLTQSTREKNDPKDLKSSTVNRQQEDAVLNAEEHPTLSFPHVVSTNSSVSVFLKDSHMSSTTSTNNHGQESTCAQTELNDSSLQNRFERTVSPSSGYSSQSGTPTHSSKDTCPTSPGRPKVKPPKPERISARISPVVSVSSSLVSLSSATGDPTNQLAQTQTNQTQQQKDSTVITPTRKITESTATALRELFNIPPPPKIKAPCPPPPETWAHNKYITELVCGPAPSAHRLYQLPKHNQKVSLISENQVSTDNSHQTVEERQISLETTRFMSEDKQVAQMERKEPVPIHEQGVLDLDREHTKSLLVHEKQECKNQNTEYQEQNGLEAQERDQEITVTLNKLPITGKVNQRMPSPTEHFKSESSAQNTGVQLQTTENNPDDPCLIECFTNKEFPVKASHKLCVQSLGTTGHIQSPSLPSECPSPPLSSETSSVSTHLYKEDLQTENEIALPNLESPWPPPPPPLVESLDSVFEGQDEIDFPPPPPPFMQELLVDMSENCSTQEKGDNLGPKETPKVSNKANDIKSNVDSQVIVNTPMKTEPSNDSLHVDLAKISVVVEETPFVLSHVQIKSIDGVPEVGENLVCSKTTVLSEISTQSQEHLEIQPAATINAPDLSQKTSHASVLINDISVIDSLPVEELSTVNFRRQPSMTNKESRCKDILSKDKSTPVPKEDANIPLVTPSLLQMVRLRSVNAEDQANPDPKDDKAVSETLPDQAQNASSQVTPQKPIRKSMQTSIKPSPATSPTPSMRLQEAVRIKTAAMSPGGLPTRLRHPHQLPPTSMYSNQVPVPFPKPVNDGDLHKTPASTASFIFSKSAKKVVIDTPMSPETQESLRQNLAAELLQISEQTKVTNGTKKQLKVPPPVAKKPVHAINLSDTVGTVGAHTVESTSIMQEQTKVNNQQTDRLHPEKQQESQEDQVSRSQTETESTAEVS